MMSDIQRSIAEYLFSAFQNSAGIEVNGISWLRPEENGYTKIAGYHCISKAFHCSV